MPKVTVTLGEIHEHQALDRKLYLTPGSDRPYWSTAPSFMHDEVLAVPQDFLEEFGYDAFEEGEVPEALADDEATLEYEAIAGGEGSQ